MPPIPPLTYPSDTFNLCGYDNLVKGERCLSLHSRSNLVVVALGGSGPLNLGDVLSESPGLDFELEHLVKLGSGTILYLGNYEPKSNNEGERDSGEEEAGLQSPVEVRGRNHVRGTVANSDTESNGDRSGEACSLSSKSTTRNLANHSPARAISDVEADGYCRSRQLAQS